MMLHEIVVLETQVSMMLHEIVMLETHRLA